MDPRFKLAYYEENSFNRSFITRAKKVVTEIWQTYKNVLEVEQSSDNVDDDLLSHVFKKRKVEHKDELKTYLNEPTMPKRTDVLLWWKVNLYNCNNCI